METACLILDWNSIQYCTGIETIHLRLDWNRDHPSTIGLE